MMNFDRNTQVVDCRLGISHGKGGSLARAGTLSQAGKLDVVVVAMGSGRRHVTKPICEITYAIRRENIQPLLTTPKWVPIPMKDCSA